MHIVISSVGTYGHVYPHIAIGQTLAQRGHEVQFLTCEYFKDHVECAGLPFISVLSTAQYLAGVRDQEVWRNPWRGVRASWRHLSPSMQQGYAALAAHIRPGESILVGNSLALWVRLAQEKFGNPAATYICPRSLCYPQKLPPFGILPGLEILPSWAVRILLNLIERAVTDPIIAPDLNWLRASLGLPPVRSVGRTWLHSPGRVICAFPDWFAAPAPDWPANTVCAGFPKLPAGELANWTRRCLPSSRRVRRRSPSRRARAWPAASYSSIARWVPARLWAGVPYSRRRSGTSCPTRCRNLRSMPPTCRTICWRRGLRRLYTRVALGPSACCWRPAHRRLFAPFTAEQTDNAMRAIALGVSLKLAPRASLRRWTKALSTLLSESSIRRSCAEITQKCGSGRLAREQIADWIEQLNVNGRDDISH